MARTDAMIPDRLPGEMTDRATALLGHMSVMQISLDARFPRQLDLDRLARAVELVLDAEPVLGCRFVHDRWRPWWRRLEKPVGDAFLVAADDASIDSFAREPLDASLGPQLQACLHRGTDGDRLLVKVGHLAADAAATKEAVERLAEIYRRLRVEPQYVPEPNVEGSRGYAQVMRRIGTRARARIWLNHQQAAYRVLAGASATQLPMRDGPGTGPATFTVRHFDRERVAALAAHGKARDASLNDMMVTALLRALCVLGDRSRPSELRLIVTADLRRHLPDGRGAGICNLSGLEPVSLGIPPDLDEGFDGLLARVTAHTLARKGSWIGLNDYVGTIPLLGWLPFAWLDALFRTTKRVGSRTGRIPPGLTNMGPIRPAVVDFDGPATSAHLLVPPTHPPNFVAGLSGYEGTLTLSTGWFPGTAPAAFIDRFMDMVVAELPG